MKNLEIVEKEDDVFSSSVKSVDFTQFELTKALYTSSIFEKIDLKPTAKLFLWALCTHYNPQKPTMFPSQATVAKKLGISEKSAERAVLELKEAGLISYVTKRVNHYVFSEKFFSLVKMSDRIRQNVGFDVRQNVGLTNKSEQKNNNVYFKSFSPSNAQNIHSTRVLPSIIETKKYIEEVEIARKNFKNPLTFSRLEALKFLSTVPVWFLDRSRTSKFLIQKYGIDVSEIPYNSADKGVSAVE